MLGSFTFARESAWESRESAWESARISPIKSKTTQQQSSGSVTLKQQLQYLLTPKKQPRLTNTGSCITWDQILIRDRLVTKAQESSKKLSWLIVLSSKIAYDTKNFSSLAQNLEFLSSQIAKDCLPIDFQKHRQQIKGNLDLLKVEISTLKQYIINLRNR